MTGVYYEDTDLSKNDQIEITDSIFYRCNLPIKSNNEKQDIKIERTTFIDPKNTYFDFKVNSLSFNSVCIYTSFIPFSDTSKIFSNNVTSFNNSIISLSYRFIGEEAFSFEGENLDYCNNNATTSSSLLESLQGKMAVNYEYNTYYQCEYPLSVFSSLKDSVFRSSYFKFESSLRIFYGGFLSFHNFIFDSSELIFANSYGWLTLDNCYYSELINPDHIDNADVVSPHKELIKPDYKLFATAACEKPWAKSPNKPEEAVLPLVEEGSSPLTYVLFITGFVIFGVVIFVILAGLLYFQVCRKSVVPEFNGFSGGRLGDQVWTTIIEKSKEKKNGNFRDFVILDMDKVNHEAEVDKKNARKGGKRKRANIKKGGQTANNANRKRKQISRPNSTEQLNAHGSQRPMKHIEKDKSVSFVRSKQDVSETDMSHSVLSSKPEEKSVSVSKSKTDKSNADDNKEEKSVSVSKSKTEKSNADDNKEERSVSVSKSKTAEKPENKKEKSVSAPKSNIENPEAVDKEEKSVSTSKGKEGKEEKNDLLSMFKSKNLGVQSKEGDEREAKSNTEEPKISLRMKIRNNIEMLLNDSDEEESESESTSSLFFSSSDDNEEDINNNVINTKEDNNKKVSFKASTDSDSDDGSKFLDIDSDSDDDTEELSKLFESSGSDDDDSEDLSKKFDFDSD